MLALAALSHVQATATVSYSFVSTGSSSSSTSSDRPGNCKDTTDCTSGYACVALQTTRSSTVTVKQCLPSNTTAICSGTSMGLCPTFSSWVSPYNQISSVCTYIPADNCASSSATKSVKGTLTCITGAHDLTGESVDAIYGCVDFDPTNEKLLFGDKTDAAKLAKTLDTAAELMNSCLDTSANSTSGLLCSGQGTCLPVGVAQLNYTCECNTGYNGTYCEGVESNKCQLPGQCATGVCNLTTQECECASGTTGDQCSECDPTSADACSGKGTCSDSVCECDDGYEGLQCQKKVKKVSNSTSSSSKAKSDGSATNVVTATSGAVSVGTASMMSIAMILASVLFMAKDE